MIDQLATHCCQCLGTLYCIRDYLGQSGISLLLSGHLFNQYVNMEVLFYGGLYHTPI